MSYPLGSAHPTDYYTFTREDGAVVSMPSGAVISPPAWTKWTLEQVREIVSHEVRLALEERES